MAQGQDMSASEILKMLSKQAQKPKFPGTNPDLPAEAATILYDQFAAFLEVGFTREEAIQLVCEILGTARA